MDESISLEEVISNQIFEPLTGFWRYNPGTDEITLSENSSLVLGLDKQTLPLQEVKKMVWEKDLAVVKQYETRMKEEKQPLGVELRIRDLKSRIIWISLYGEYHPTTNASEEYYSGYFINITAQKRKELKLKIANSNFEKIEGISRMGSFNWVLSEDYLLCSDNFFSLTKLKNTHPDNKLNKVDFFELINNESKNFVLDVMQEGVVTNQCFEVSFGLSHYPEVKLKLFGYPINNEFFGLVQDISYGGEGRKSLIEGQDSERRRISLELHDSVGQKLIAVKYKLALMKMTNNINELDYVNKSIDEIIDEVRNITHNLSSQIVNEVGLKEAINQILSETASALSANKHFEYDVESNKLSVDTEKMIYRIIQESLSNALKHSKADNISIKLNIINHQVSISVSDDGVGFDSNGGSIKKGIGLQNIKERVTYLNGFFKLISEKGKGTSIKVRIPLSQI